ncbi:hypothetical protein H9W95_02855 [Flavobacterium lindanitolerans]|nr:hypothetical protein [Flavobacterium lindanitolerans]
MSTQIKNTLFRFMTMRAPELIDDSETKNHFVQIDETTEYAASHFLNGILNEPDGERKKQLQSFVSFESQNLKLKKKLVLLWAIHF